MSCAFSSHHLFWALVYRQLGAPAGVGGLTAQSSKKTRRFEQHTAVHTFTAEKYLTFLRVSCLFHFDAICTRLKYRSSSGTPDDGLFVSHKSVTTFFCTAVCMRKQYNNPLDGFSLQVDERGGGVSQRIPRGKTDFRLNMKHALPSTYD